ncbi:MAG: T9SS type A sorting domain-containing protein [Bacteroidales bacterium]|nr:T9SS type A sorting domain-containing protein [Bacteroidales bacterium]
MKRRFTILTAVFALLVFTMPSLVAWGQTRTETTIYSCSGGGTVEGWTFQNNVTTNVIDKTTYWLLDAGDPSDYIQTCSYNLSSYSSASLSLKAATFGSGGNPTAVVQVSYDGGSSFTTLTLSGNQPTSTTYNTLTASIASGLTSTVVIKYSNGATTGKGLRLQNLVLTATSGTTTTPTTVTIDATGITNTDVHTGTAAGSLSATVTENTNNTTVNGATVTWSSSETGVATIASDGTVTLVAAGTTTITAAYAGDATYSSSSATYTLTVADSTPFDGVIFDATVDKDENNTTQGEGSITKDNVTFSCTSGILGNGSEYRMYKNSTTTISITGGNRITKIEFIGTSSNPASGFGSQTGWTTSGYNGVWQGEAESVSFVASGAQVRATMIRVTVLEVTTPSISANDVNIAYDATSGEIAYILNNSVANGSLSVSDNVDWISNPVLNTTENKVTFTTTANEATTARVGIVTITYTYNRETVTKDVTVTQAAAPVIYTTIPALYAAATETETEVFVTFNNWVVSGVSTNGKNVYVTDNSGNGFIIYFTSNMSETFSAGKILNGTAVSCKLKLYNGAAELVNLNASDLSITDGDTVSIVNIAMANLSGVNTGALVHYDNLTCSMDNNKYYLSDGTTTVQAYNTLYAFNEFEAGKAYNVTGVYVQYNTVKEIAPRSADDIEEVVENYTLTIANPEHIGLTIAYGNEIFQNGESASIESGTEITLTVNVDEGYVLEDLTVTGGDNQNVTVTETSTSGVYTFNMPAFDATVNATATEYVAPTGDNYELFTDVLVEGDYLIVYNGKAMNNTVSSNRLQYDEVTATNNVITTDNAEIVWHIAPSGDYWTIYSADAEAYAASTGTKNQATTMIDGTDDKALWTVSGIETYEFVNKYNATNSVNANLRNNGTYGFACYASGTGGALSLYKKIVEPETYTLTINGYEAGSDGGYYLITTPVTVDPVTVAGMTEGEFDLYQFNQSADKEWENWNVHHFNLVPGKGYLYAKQATTPNEVFQFELTGTPYDGTPICLSKTGNGPFVGWNLVGNPFNQNLYLDQDFYIMGDDGDEIIASNSAEVTPMQGFFVIADEDGEELHFIAPLDPIKLVINVSKDRGNVIDRAIVRFDEGRQLPKFQLNPNNTKIYVTEGNQDFAVVRSANEGEMPVSFKAAENGTYTINVDVENMEMDYLHLIDNMTGADVDLLQTPSYTFEASTRDYASRFRLVFSAEENGASAGSATFAYFNGNEWVVSNEGDAQLHVIDMTGRIVSTETINGNATVKVNAAPGVYMLRLVNGNDIKTQKVIIK